jgi:hypothetical protein
MIYIRQTAALCYRIFFRKCACTQFTFFAFLFHNLYIDTVKLPEKWDS